MKAVARQSCKSSAGVDAQRMSWPLVAALSWFALAPLSQAGMPVADHFGAFVALGLRAALAGSFSLALLLLISPWASRR